MELSVSHTRKLPSYMQVLAQYLPDLFTPVAARMAVLCNFPIYYEWGHQPEIAQKLTNLDKTPQTKTKKYPLMWLVMDFKEAKGANMDVYTKTSISIVFAVGTQPLYTEQQRRDKSFLPTLLPMYQAFLQALSESSSFRKPYGPLIKHDFALRPYWGDGTNHNVFNDFVDCIEITNLSLDVKQLICNPSKISFK